MGPIRPNHRWLLALALLATLVAGCQAPPLPPQKAASDGTRRSGQVYLIRGLLGIFSTGMDHVQDRLQAEGIRAIAVQHTESGSVARTLIEEYRHCDTHAPIVLIGHSLGADEVIYIAQEVSSAGVPIELAITVDPVTADPVPANVRRTINYYRSGPLDVVPAFRGIPLKQRKPGTGVLVNIDINQHEDLLEPGTNHFTIDKNTRIESAIVRQVLEVCPREQQHADVARAQLPARRSDLVAGTPGK